MRSTYRSRNRMCDNCGRGLLQHDQQLYCRALTHVELAKHTRTFVGMDIEVRAVVEGKQISCRALLISVTETKHAVWADFVEGWSVQISQGECAAPELDMCVREAEKRDSALFAEIFQKGHYGKLELNERLQSMVTSQQQVASL